jgi:hypothetical protein
VSLQIESWYRVGPFIIQVKHELKYSKESEGKGREMLTRKPPAINGVIFLDTIREKWREKTTSNERETTSLNDGMG